MATRFAKLELFSFAIMIGDLLGGRIDGAQPASLYAPFRVHLAMFLEPGGRANVTVADPRHISDCFSAVQAEYELAGQFWREAGWHTDPSVIGSSYFIRKRLAQR
jgi:hypothetical protein